MYSALAKYYDAFMEDVDYDSWARYVALFLGDRRRGADLACGSGGFTLRLAKLGYDIYGVDISSAMLSAAKQKALDAGIRAEFLLGPIERFRPASPLSFYLVMCDGMNYVKDLCAAVKNLYAGLETGGVLIFDLSSEYKLKNILGNNVFSDQSGDVTYIWRNRYHEKKRAVEMELTFFEKRGALYHKSTETQTQYAHSEADVTAALLEAGFRDIKVYADLTKRKPKSDTQRIHFVAFKT